MNEVLDINFEDGELSNSFLDQVNPDDKRDSYNNSSLSFMKKSESVKIENNENSEKFYFYSKGKDLIDVVDLMNYIAFPSFEDAR